MEDNKTLVAIIGIAAILIVGITMICSENERHDAQLRSKNYSECLAVTKNVLECQYLLSGKSK